LTTVPTQEADSSHSEAAGGFEGAEDVRAVPRCRNANQDITGSAQRLDLSAEHLVKPEVVAYARQNGGVGVERDRAERLSIVSVTAHEFSRQVLTVRCATAVSTPKDGPTLFKNTGEAKANNSNGCRQRSGNQLDCPNMLKKAMGNDLVSSQENCPNWRNPSGLRSTSAVEATISCE
jgi:hypothetical protein